jgi:hypothetical protein
MKPEPNPEILEYIVANQAIYTRTAIERELREAGHSQEAIDAAWRALPVEGEAPLPSRGSVATAQFWVLLLLVACLGLTLLPFLSFRIGNLLLTLLESAGAINRTWRASGLAFFLATLTPALLIYLAIGAGAWRLRRRDEAVAYGIFGGLLVAFVLSVIVAGACAALIAQM